MSNEPAERTVRIDLGALNAGVTVSVSKIMNMTAIALQGAQLVDVATIELPTNRFHMRFAGTLPVDEAAALVEFERWITTTALQECIRVAGTFLEGVHSVCALWSLGNRVTADAWNEAMAQSQSFHELGLPQRARRIQKGYGRHLLGDYLNDVLSINGARNCLEHRNGIVSALDTNKQGELVVRWRKVQLLHNDEPFEMAEGGVVLGPGTISARFNERVERRFKLGERVRFSADDVAELCWTLNLFATNATQHLEAFGRAHGVEFTSPTHAVDVHGSDGQSTA